MVAAPPPNASPGASPGAGPDAALYAGSREPPALGPALATLTAAQAAISAAMFAPGVIAPRLDIHPALLGSFAAIVFGIAAVVTARSGPWILRLGSLTTVAIACLLAGLAMALAAVGGSVGLVVAALVLGVAAGPETPAAAALLGRLTPAKRRPFVFSVRQTGNQIGAAAGSLVLPLVVAVVDPRLGYALVGAATVAVAIAAFALARRYDRPDPAAARGALVRVPIRAVLANRPLGTLAVASMAFGAMQLSLNTFFVSYAVEDLGHPHVAAGVALGAAQLAGLVGRLGWGALAGRLAPARTIIAGLGAGMALAALVLALAGPSLSFPALVVLAVLFGATASGWNGIYIAEIARLAPPDRIAETTGAALALSYGGLLAGPLLYAVAAALAGLSAGFAVLALAAAAATVLVVKGERP